MKLKKILIIAIGVYFTASFHVYAQQKAEEKSNMDQYSHNLVTKGEFPAAGHSYEVDFGPGMQYILDFKSEKQMTYRSKTDSNVTETVDISVTKLRMNLFLVTWVEKAGNTVVHIEDFENNQIYTNITMEDGTFYRKRGSISRLK